MAGSPVRVQWTREDEIRNGYYHAASAHRLKAGLDANGKVVAWHHTGAWPSLIALWAPTVKTGHAIEFGLGLIDTPYNEVPNLRIENGEADAMIRVGWYRSVKQHPARLHDELLHPRAGGGGGGAITSNLLLEMIGEAEVMDLAADGVEGHWNYGDSVEEWPIMPNRLSNVLRVAAAKSATARPCRRGTVSASRCTARSTATWRVPCTSSSATTGACTSRRWTWPSTAAAT